MTTRRKNVDILDIESAERVGLDVLENTLSFYFRILDFQLSRDLDQRMGPLEIARGKGKITALLLIDSNPSIRPSKVAAMAMMDRSAMARILDHFERHGLITREVSAQDQRAQGCFITSKGAELAEKVRAIVISQSEDFFCRILPRDEQEVLIDILKRAYNRMLEAKK